MDLDGELPDWMPNLTLMEWVVVGVVIVVVLLGLCGVCCCCCAWRKKKRKAARERWAQRANYEEKKESDKAALVERSLKLERERHELEREKWMDTEVERRIQTELEKKEAAPQPKVELAVELEQLNKVEQQVELLVELAKHGSSVNSGLTGYNSRDQLLMELARKSEMDSRERLVRTGTESYRAESESYQGSRMGSDRWADSGKGSELFIDQDRETEELIASPRQIRSPKLTNEGKVRIPMKNMKQAEPPKETDDELKRLVQELREREREKLIQELRVEARAKLEEELSSDRHVKSEKERFYEAEEAQRAQRQFEQPKHNRSERSEKSSRSDRTEKSSRSERHFEPPRPERHYENPGKGAKSPLLRELETQRKETLDNINREKAQLMKTESKLLIAPEPDKKTVQAYAGGWLADNAHGKEPSEPWRVIRTDEKPHAKDLHSLQSPSVMRHTLDNSGSDTYSEEESEGEGQQGWKRLRSPEINRRREAELKRAEEAEQARLVQELIREEQEMLKKVESQQSLFEPKTKDSTERHFEQPRYENPVKRSKKHEMLSPPPPLPPRPVRSDKFMGSKKSNLDADRGHETSETSDTERLMGLNQFESDEDNQWSSDGEEGRSVGTTRSEVERNEWIQSEQARWIQAEEAERSKYQRAML